MIVDILRHTPLWVYLLFGGLLAISAGRLRDGVRDVRRVAIVPAIFILWGVISLLARHDVAAIAMWLAGAASGGLLGSFSRPQMQTDRVTGDVWLPGSALPALRLLLIFGAHYLLHVAAALRPEQAASLLHWDATVSGMAAGYFVGWGLRFHQAWRNAPAIDAARRAASERNATA